MSFIRTYHLKRGGLPEDKLSEELESRGASLSSLLLIWRNEQKQAAKTQQSVFSISVCQT